MDLDFTSVLDALEKEHGDHEPVEAEGEDHPDLVLHDDGPSDTLSAHVDEQQMGHREDLDDDDEAESAEPEGEIEIQLYDDPEEALEDFQDAKEDAEDELFKDEGENDDTEELAFELPDDFELPPDILPGAKGLTQRPHEDEQRETNWEKDGDHKKFLHYLVERLKSIPPHSGQTTVGVEKAISYLRKLDKEISKAIQSDEHNVINESKAEELRDKIHGYIDQLEEAYDELMSYKGRKKKKAAGLTIEKEVVVRQKRGSTEYYVQVEKDGELALLQVQLAAPTKPAKTLSKEAAAIFDVLDPFLQSISRLLIRAHITQGKDIQAVYRQLHDQYQFTPREELSIHEILLQKGLPLNVDLGRIHEKNPSSFDSKNVEYSTEFFA